MTLIALVSLELGALRLASPLSVDACRFFTVAALAWATILARVRKGEAGAFWFGFALAGWAAFLLVLDTLGSQSSTSLVGAIPRLLANAVYGRPSVPFTPTVRDRLVQQFLIVHYLMVLPVAALGGLGGWLTARWRPGRPDDYAPEENGRRKDNEDAA
jgi:hypothetical protein